MRDFSAVYTLPNGPAVYAFHGSRYVAYVGIAGRLKQRIIQHVIRRDSSAAVATSAIILNPDQLSGLNWWEHPAFNKTVHLKAAELIAFEILNPALRSRSGTDKAGHRLAGDGKFSEEISALFHGPPTGSISFPSLVDAMDRIGKLEEQVKKLSDMIDQLRCRKDEV